MQRTRMKGLVLAGVGVAFLSSMTMTGQESRAGVRGSTRPARVTESPARVTAPSRPVVSFRSERTDSWLCQNVSVFFCGREAGMVIAPPPSPSPATRGRR